VLGLRARAAFNMLVEDIGKSWAIDFNNDCKWFHENLPVHRYDDLEYVDEALQFLNDWEIQRAALGPQKMDLSVRKEPRIHLSAGRWLRLWSHYSKFDK
jgi:hypothetical protein